MGFFFGKCILIIGVVSKLFIVYGIVQVMYCEGVELVFIYQNEKLKGCVEEFVVVLGFDIVLLCDVVEDESIIVLFIELEKVWLKFDGFVYLIGFVLVDQLDGDYVDVVICDGFKIVYDISVYSFVVMVKVCCGMLNLGLVLLMFFYLGVECVILNYNVMGLVKVFLEVNVCYMVNVMGLEGVCVNVIFVGFICMLVVFGIKDFCKMLVYCEVVILICCIVIIEDVGNSVVFLCFNLFVGIFGEVVYVDGGFNIVVMNELELK